MDPSRRGAPRPGYETRDVSVRGVLWSGLVLVVVMLGAAAAMKAAFDVLRAREAGRQAPPSPVAAAGPEEPPEPRLEADPGKTLAALTVAEEKDLNEYGWVDPAAGIVRIPIERAMDLIVREGLPVAAPPGPEGRR